MSNGTVDDKPQKKEEETAERARGSRAYSHAARGFAN